MADLKRKGDLAELAVAADLVRRGYKGGIRLADDYEDPPLASATFVPPPGAWC